MKLSGFGRVISEPNPSAIRRISLAFTAAACLIVGSTLAGGQSVHASAAGSPGIPGMPRPDHVVLVMEENHSYSEIIGSSHAPYINSLAQQGALLTSSYAIEHPSEPNYLDLFSGSNQGVHDDSCPHTFSTPNLGSYLLYAGLSFVGYSEDLPSPGSQVCSSGAYARRHSPWVNFSNVPAASNLPFTSFPSDYSTLPTISWVIPNLDNDMHDGSIQQGDTWLQQNIGPYATWAVSHNSLLIVTWDEDDGSSSNRIATIMYGPMVARGSYSETVNHYNVLRTLEDMYDLPYAGQSGNVQPITDIWTGSLPTGTITPASTMTSTPTNTGSPTRTPTSVNTGTPGSTRTPTRTATASPTSTSSDTPASTDTPTLVPSGTPVSTDTPTVVPSDTPVSTASPDATSTAAATWTPSLTATPTGTPGSCHADFTDVHSSDYFHAAVEYLYCHGAISGYSDGTFRPYNNTTRGQLSKIVVLAVGWDVDTRGGPHFSDVPVAYAFYPYIETAYNHRVISGYSDGTFRPGANVTRGQLSKIIVTASAWPINTTGGPHFTDVAVGSPFFAYIETAYNRRAISGYSDGTFQPYNQATRGQISKIVYNAVTQ